MPDEREGKCVREGEMSVKRPISKLILACLMLASAGMFMSASLVESASLAVSSDGFEPTIPFEPLESDAERFGVWDEQGASYLFDRINAMRRAEDRTLVVRSEILDELARVKARDMAVHRYFSHYSPVFGSIYDMLDREGLAYKWAGENIARADSVERAHEALTESSGHRANLISEGYTRVGVGVFNDGTKVYVSQIFMRPR